MADQKRYKTETPGSAADIAMNAISAPPRDSHQRPISEVAKLPAAMRELVESMLVEGATFEDVCDALNERGVPLTLQAVQNRYRGDLELQKRRIEFQVERAQVLTQALVDPDSSDAQLAHAALLTGLQTLSRNGREMTMKDAVKVLLERRNIRLKGELMRMRIKREEEEKRFRKTRLHAEILKLRLTRARLVQLERELKKPENSSTLGRVALEKIQEIYGLLQIPVIPRDVEVAHAEPRATGEE
jgi:Bacteriophage Mu, Gp27